MHETQSKLRGHRPRLSMTVAAVVILMIATACGTDDAAEEANPTLAPPASAAPSPDGDGEASDTSAATAVTPTATTATSASEALPEAEPFPEGALPIADAYEFEQNTFATVKHGSYIYLLHDFGVSRLNTTDSKIDYVPFDVDFEFLPWWIASTDSHVLVPGSDSSFSSADRLVSIETDTFTVDQTFQADPGEQLLPYWMEGTASVIGSIGPTSGTRNLARIDPQTLTALEEIPVPAQGHTVFEIDDQLWDVARSGQIQVLDGDAYSVLGTIDLGQPNQVFGIRPLAVTEEALWFVDSAVGTAVKVDRVTFELGPEVTIGERYGKDSWDRPPRRRCQLRDWSGGHDRRLRHGLVGVARIRPRDVRGRRRTSHCAQWR